MLGLYSFIMRAGTPFLKTALKRRCKQGKEDPHRLEERMGISTRPRPEGHLVWFHAASVGEAQSALILIDAVLEQNPELHILVTTGTLTSAELMMKRLPDKAFHQYIPLDHPQWTKAFLSHWQPDFIFWLESELWPNMLGHIRNKKIPAALVNARLSPSSFKNWKKAKQSIANLLDAFTLILAQTKEDVRNFKALGADDNKVILTDNIKYSAQPLPYDEAALNNLKKATKNRPLWLYASTHDGEELLACRIHHHLKKKHPGLLTIIVPRHPDRRDAIMATCGQQKIKARLRGNAHSMPQNEDDVYIADTLGELGLFYRLAPIACIGRSFSNDGGGGHNPIEAAQLDCAVLHGPHVQNLSLIFEEMDSYGAALNTKTEKKLEDAIDKLLGSDDTLHTMQNKAHQFAHNKARVLDRVMKALLPLLEENGLTQTQGHGKDKETGQQCA